MTQRLPVGLLTLLMLAAALRARASCAVVVPLSPETRGHGTHTFANVWKPYLAEPLRGSE